MHSTHVYAVSVTKFSNFCNLIVNKSNLAQSNLRPGEPPPTTKPKQKKKSIYCTFFSHAFKMKKTLSSHLNDCKRY